ncbi:hypothetical protein [Deinococcus yavapaiensis]|uniref:Uncharacterized protein n=1 Tax=Deinococcus yavapaiensis KR-236 TaxID=694435 RepID=A0A318S548_9DEIO|nr:hypothetical protein [Deinococcus yavapaiensis]PYE50943.1 hypothetical protein DES52_1169 [Deinococcus yavapaiensis KR-236]
MRFIDRDVQHFEKTTSNAGGGSHCRIMFKRGAPVPDVGDVVKYAGDAYRVERLINQETRASDAIAYAVQSTI